MGHLFQVRAVSSGARALTINRNLQPDPPTPVPGINPAADESSIHGHSHRPIDDDDASWSPVHTKSEFERMRDAVRIAIFDLIACASNLTLSAFFSIMQMSTKKCKEEQAAAKAAHCRRHRRTSKARLRSA